MVQPYRQWYWHNRADRNTGYCGRLLVSLLPSREVSHQQMVAGSPKAKHETWVMVDYPNSR